jgi:hypothetical protein
LILAPNIVPHDFIYNKLFINKCNEFDKALQSQGFNKKPEPKTRVLKEGD